RTGGRSPGRPCAPCRVCSRARVRRPCGRGPTGCPWTGSGPSSSATTPTGALSTRPVRGAANAWTRVSSGWCAYGSATPPRPRGARGRRGGGRRGAAAAAARAGAGRRRGRRVGRGRVAGRGGRGRVGGGGRRGGRPRGVPAGGGGGAAAIPRREPVGG